MLTIYEEVLNIIGPIPVGYEIIAWIVSALFLLFILTSVISIFASVFNWIGGKR